MNLNKVIYLIGHINPAKPETYAWREEFMAAFKDDETVKIINPCDSSFDTNLLEKQDEDPERLAAYKKKSTRICVRKSFQSVDESTMCIANLDTYGSKAPMIGTLFELAWYLNNPHKTVIGLLTENAVSKDAYAAHPFVAESVHVWTKSVKEAVRMVGMFFL
jgi:hypothetical protein